jgi:hypothetical protein
MQWKCVTRTESFAFISSVHDHWQPIPNGQNLWIKVGYLYSYSGIAYNGTIPCIPHIAIIPWKWLDIWYRWPGVKINHHQPIRKHQLLSHTKPTTEGPRDRLEVTMTFFWGSLNLSSCNWLPIFPSPSRIPLLAPKSVELAVESQWKSWARHDNDNGAVVFTTRCGAPWGTLLGFLIAHLSLVITTINPSYI